MPCCNSKSKILPQDEIEGAIQALRFFEAIKSPDQSVETLLTEALADLMPTTGWNEIEPAIARLKGFAGILALRIAPALLPPLFRPALVIVISEPFAPPCFRKGRGTHA